MLTPNDVRVKKRKIHEDLRSSELIPHMAEIDFRMDQISFFCEVLREIAHGSIDPKSLARAALEPEEKF